MFFSVSPHICFKSYFTHSELEIIDQPFFKSRNIAIDYRWLPYWKCTVNMVYQIGFNWPNGENWSENGRWPTFIFKLCTLSWKWISPIQILHYQHNCLSLLSSAKIIGVATYLKVGGGGWNQVKSNVYYDIEQYLPLSAKLQA